MTSGPVLRVCQADSDSEILEVARASYRQQVTLQIPIAKPTATAHLERLPAAEHEALLGLPTEEELNNLRKEPGIYISHMVEGPAAAATMDSAVPFAESLYIFA